MSKKYFCDKCDRNFNDPLPVVKIGGKDLDLCAKCHKKFRKAIRKTGKKFVEGK